MEMVFLDKPTVRLHQMLFFPIADNDRSFGGVALATVFIFFKNPKRKVSELTLMQKIGQMDLLGAFFLICGIVCLLLALQWGGTVYPWSDSRAWGCLLGFGLIIAVFIGLQFWRDER